jgi:hypothetical protein
MPLLAGRTADGGMSAVIGVRPNTGTSGVAPVDVGGPTGGLAVVDGTPVRVVAISLAAALGLIALRMGGFRFNVGISGG